MPDDLVDKVGGEEWTSKTKQKVGKSKSDLYWNPKTGDVYSRPKKGGPFQWINNIPPRKNSNFVTPITVDHENDKKYGLRSRVRKLPGGI
ncbi:MAG: hypothetical protein M0T74_04020 [Desulfitobacterium hafniense]|nr:hypothetical protein [Desulfitobacterium hafniense]